MVKVPCEFILEGSNSREKLSRFCELNYYCQPRYFYNAFKDAVVMNISISAKHNGRKSNFYKEIANKTFVTYSYSDIELVKEEASTALLDSFFIYQPHQLHNQIQQLNNQLQQLHLQQAQQQNQSTQT